MAGASSSCMLESESLLNSPKGRRHLAIAGRRGHVAAFDWQSGRLHTELHLNETCRAIRWLHNESFFAVAQKKCVYIYDKDGLEVHQLRNHSDVNQLEFLPYHWLLASIGNAGFLKYQDTSTGQLVAEFRTKLGACHTMAQNSHNAFIHLGHQNGTVSLWSPSVPRPQVRILAHKGPITDIAIDPSSSGQRMATLGLDGAVKIWDLRKYDVLNEFTLKRAPASAHFSQKGLLSVAWGNHVSVYSDVLRKVGETKLAPSPYMNQGFPGRQVQDVHFCPFEDVLGVGHAQGFTSLIIPGAGEANFDSLEADPYESKRRRREREVHALLDKIPHDLITLDTDLVGQIDKSKAKETTNKLDSLRPQYRPTPFAKKPRLDRLQIMGEADDENESEDDEDTVRAEARAAAEEKRTASADGKKRMRGKNSSLKRALRKRNRNIIDPMTMAIKERMAAKRREAMTTSSKQAS